LKPTDFKTPAKLVRSTLTNLTADVHCGTKTGYMGNRGGYGVFATQAWDSGLALAERKGRLVVFVPYDADGFGAPRIVKGTDNGTGFDYRPPDDAQTSGYFLVK